jgi:hypothetical protein
VPPPAAPPSRFVWLFAPTASPPAPLRSDDDAGAACDFAYENWRILPAILPRLEKWLGKYGTAARLKPVRERAAAAHALAELEAVCQDRVATELRARQIPHAFLKSSAIRWFAYDDPHARCGWDIDVGVSKARLEDARDAAHHLGYMQAEGFVDPPWFRPADPQRVAAVESDHYELGFLVRRVRVRDLAPAVEKAVRGHIAAGGRTSWHLTPEGDVACYVTLDIHHGISTEISLDPILATSRTFDADGMQLRIPRPAWLLMHLVYKIYWEGVHDYGVGGYQYADLCRLVPRIDDEEVAFFRLIAARWQLEAAAHFVLRRLTPEFSLPLSGAMQELVDDMAIPNDELNPIEQNDLGDMWAKLWGAR